MRIALLGYGKMGKAIENVALQRGHEIVLKIGSNNTEDLSHLRPDLVDVVIEFSRPELAAKHITFCNENGLPVVCGTTAWQSDEANVYDIIRKTNGALVHASNFSPGVNLFFLLNSYLAKLMSKWPDYKVSITETHHTAKLDAPSGTAITLAESILNNREDLKTWVLGPSDNDELLSIQAIRKDPAPGTHTIHYSSTIDEISITHEAHNREGFATGAVMAAEWIIGKKGVFAMKDVLGL
ncbi:MAG: 4-hydroxy-tetrahydrodipicolinate reductase [Saprospiraceae bacterium]|nr:4-hydroxy-tetrahydrodipicolinate reductase [Saprospiraceae bacterium]MBK8851054.1 4-hydroxy-tetrahydrodipicolinate reductase [Saprospiraceae bacterium]